MAGRKRKKGERTKSGRLKARADKGSRQLREMRAFLAGIDEHGDVIGDPAKTVYPLGIMFTNEIIDENTHRAGCRYAWLHTLIFGRVSIAAARYDEMIGGTDEVPDPKWLRACRAELRDADRSFASTKARDCVANLVVFERTPMWLHPRGGIPTEADIREGRMTLEALVALAAALAGPMRKQGVRTWKAA